ncbi:trypco2 family protein [Streptomyces chartreusis]|uniref:trypco2 family protein n=1 Tax=Streptomyces chartreusis TaxID=1969 RepID=UPI0036818705
MTDHRIELADAVQAVRDELITAAARSSGQDVTFEVGDIELEFSVELRKGHSNSRRMLWHCSISRTWGTCPGCVRSACGGLSGHVPALWAPTGSAPTSRISSVCWGRTRRASSRLRVKPPADARPGPWKCPQRGGGSHQSRAVLVSSVLMPDGRSQP